MKKKETKTLKKLGIQVPQPDHGNTNIILNGVRLDVFPLRSRKRKGCPFSHLLFDTVLEVPARVISQEKEKKEV